MSDEKKKIIVIDKTLDSDGQSSKYNIDYLLSLDVDCLQFKTNNARHTFILDSIGHIIEKYYMDDGMFDLLCDTYFENAEGLGYWDKKEIIYPIQNKDINK
jgi:hypothetical protein